MLTPLIVAFFVTLGLALILTPLVIKFAPMIGAMDKPNTRKVHQVPTPRLGGVAIFISFFGGMFSLCLMRPEVLSTSWIFGKEGMILMAALFFVLCLGIWDDIRSLKPGQKFTVQLVLSVMIHFAGFSVLNVTNTFGVESAMFGFLDFPLTVLWIVGVTNALNLIDGLDGLAAGVSTIAAVTILAICLLQGDFGTAILAVMLVGSLIGFLHYNFNPAKIFLGDSGSLFIGFLLAVLSVKSSTKSSAGFALLIPILALGLPIVDTVLAMIRRFLRSFLSDRSNPKIFVSSLRSMFQPDSGHIHHILINRGLSHRNAVIMLYIASSILGIGAFAITFSGSLVASLVLVLVGGITMIGIHQLKYKEMSMLQNEVLLPLYNKSINQIRVLFEDRDEKSLSHLFVSQYGDLSTIGSDQYENQLVENNHDTHTNNGFFPQLLNAETN